MKKSDYKFIIGVTVFIIGLLITVLLQINQSSSLLCWASFCISLFYLLFGWFFFKGYFPEGHPLLLFLFGYLYSGIFISIFFWSKVLPLAKVFIFLAPLWVIILAILILSLKKKIPKIGFRQFSIEGLLLLIISIVLLIRFF